MEAKIQYCIVQPAVAYTKKKSDLSKCITYSVAN